MWATAPSKVIPAGEPPRSGGVERRRDGRRGHGRLLDPGREYSFYFDNPFFGSDGFSVTTPAGYDDNTTQVTGNDQILTSRCFKVG